MSRILRYLDHINILLKAVEKGKLPQSCMSVLEKALDDFVDKLYQYTKILAGSNMCLGYCDIEKMVSRYNLICKGRIGEETIEFIKNRLSKPCVYDFFGSVGDDFQKYVVTRRDFEQLHHCICNSIFKEIEQSKNSETPFWIRIDHDDSWGQEQGGELREFESGDYIRLTMLSESALEYDKIIFAELSRLEDASNEGWIRGGYRPFFMDYYIEAYSLDDRRRDFLRRMKREAEGGEQNGEQEYESNGWYRAYFTDGDGSAGEGGVLFYGAYAFSASPVYYKKRKLMVETKKLDPKIAKEINSTYQVPVEHIVLDQVIEDWLKTFLKGVVFRSAQVYKVGNGNCICFCGGSAKREMRLLYDVGFDEHIAVKEKVSSMPFSYQPALRSIRRINPDCVIISHWDADHYKACAYCNKKLFECMWIAPYCGDASTNAKRLAKYLQLIGKIKFVERSRAREIVVPLIGNSILRLYVGTKKSGERLTAANCEGIAVRYDNGITRCLMQGDVPYLCLPPQANLGGGNHYDYLVAPHHGSKMNLSSLAPQQNKQGNAVICCNNNKSKVRYRPAAEHLKALQGCYAAVEVTENADCYVELDFMNTNRMTLR